MPSHTPQLLISVRSPAEALVALEGGADIIDIKEPACGPLGMAEPATIELIIAAVDGRRPTSAALGDLHDALPPSIELRLNYTKVGLSALAPSWRDDLATRFAFAPGAGRVVVLYGDELSRQAAPHAFVAKALDWLEDHNGEGLLLDTRDKAAGDLFACLPMSWVCEIIESTRARGLLIALAGRLTGDSLRRAADLSPDIIGVRGAACREGDRGQMLDASRVRLVRSIISEPRALQARPAKAGAAG